MATEKRQIEVDLLARNKMGPATKGAADDLDKVGKSAKKAADAATDMGKASAFAGEGAEKFGKDANDAQRHVDNLGDEIRKVEQDLVLLAGAFATAEDAAERLDISKGIRKAEAELRRLSKVRGILENIDPEPAARSFMTKLGGAITGSAGQLTNLIGKGPGGVIGAALGVAAAPVLISAMGSAISAGAGAGAIGAGIALAVSKSPEIQRAGIEVGKRFMTSMQESASKAFGGPLLTSINLLGGAADRVAKKWDGAFKALSGSVVPLTRDIITGVERINDAMVNVASKSQPAISALGDAWVLLADGAGDALETLSDGSSKAAGNLVVLAGATADVVKLSTNFLGVIGKLSGNPWLTGPLLPFLREHYGDAADATEKFTGATNDAAGAMTAAERAARGNADGIAELNNELLKQANPAFAVIESQIKLGEAQKKAAEATKKHGRNSAEAREATRNLAKAALELQGNVGKLGKDFDGKLTPAMRSSLAAAGLTEKQINDVEREFGQARKAGDRYAKTYTAATKVYGASAARKSLYSVKEVADGIPRVIAIAMKITGNKSTSASLAAFRKNAGSRAGGGPIEKGRPYWVGEEGPELVVPEAAGRVLTASTSRRIAAGALPGGSSGGGAINMSGGRSSVLRLELVGQQELVTMFRYLVRSANLLQTGS